VCVNGRLSHVMQVVCGFDPDHGHPDMIAPVIADFVRGNEAADGPDGHAPRRVARTAGRSDQPTRPASL